jgi:glycosyltransferase involved in cell wall biosynthesis
MEKNVPKVSVLMPVYNTPEEYLRAAIESILKQTFQDFEFLILDDGSTENNVEAVVRSYADPRIVFGSNGKNLGIASSRNKLIDLSVGEYLAVMDHDDISLPERLRTQADYLDNHPEVGVLGTWAEKFPHRRIARYPQTNAEIEDMLMYHLPFEHPSMMFRKSVLLRNDIQYDREFKVADDYDMCSRLIGKTHFANLPLVLFHYRSHKGNTVHRRKYKMWDETGLICGAARAANPEIWNRARRRSVCEKQYRLFGFIPLLTVRKQGKKTKYYLFGCILVMRGKEKEGIPDKPF